MKSTCVARAHPARQATGDLIRQWRRTAENLCVPLLIARDNLGCNDVYTLCLYIEYRECTLKADLNDKGILFAKILPTVIEQKVR